MSHFEANWNKIKQIEISVIQIQADRTGSGLGLRLSYQMCHDDTKSYFKSYFIKMLINRYGIQ